MTESSAKSGVLVVENLTTEIDTPRGTIRPVDGVSFTLERGKTLGVVGESGSGKSMLVRTIMGVSPPRARVSGKVYLDGVDLFSLSRKDHEKQLGAGIAMVFQDPMTSLNPVVPVGRQITEGMRFHLGLDRGQANEKALDLLTQVGISDPARRLKQYPHQLSGGMRQRVCIAAALACDPKVLIADEATTALDVTIQQQILDLLKRIQVARDMSVIVISHDLGVVAGRTDELAVMYVGKVVETGSTINLYGDYKHRYTEALLKSLPKFDHEPHTRLATITGALPSLVNMPPGCRFAPRCSAATDECRATEPELTAVEGQDHLFRCYHPAGSTPSEPVVEKAGSPS